MDVWRRILCRALPATLMADSLAIHAQMRGQRGESGFVSAHTNLGTSKSVRLTLLTRGPEDLLCQIAHQAGHEPKQPFGGCLFASAVTQLDAWAMGLEKS